MKNVVVAVILGVIAVIAGLTIERGVSEACGQLAEMNNNPGTPGYVGDGNRIVTNANGTRTLYLSEGTAYEQVHQLPAAGSNTTPAGVNCNAALPAPHDPSDARNGANTLVHRDANGNVIDSPGRLGSRTGYTGTTRLPASQTTQSAPALSPAAQNILHVRSGEASSGRKVVNVDRYFFREMSVAATSNNEAIGVEIIDGPGDGHDISLVLTWSADPTTEQHPVRICKGRQSATDPGGCTPHPSDTEEDTAATPIGRKCGLDGMCDDIYPRKLRYPDWPYTDSNEDTLIAGVVYNQLPQETREARVTLTATSNRGTVRTTVTVTVFVDPNNPDLNTDPDEGGYVTPAD